MRKATIRIQRNTDAALEKMGERFVKAWKAGKSAGDTLAFESPAALFRVLTPKRWELVERLQELGPRSVRGLARELERDVKRVHEDVGVLIECGLVARTADGKINLQGLPPPDAPRTARTCRADSLTIGTMHAATALKDLTSPPGNRLEKLKGDRVGQHSIRINDQYRVCFVWRDGDADDVEIADYH